LVDGTNIGIIAKLDIALMSVSIPAPRSSWIANLRRDSARRSYQALNRQQWTLPHFHEPEFPGNRENNREFQQLCLPRSINSFAVTDAAFS
jgi:hypothetical protein